MTYEYVDKKILMMVDGKEVGYIEYELKDNSINILHTVVYSEFQGRGYARELVNEAIAYADKQGYALTSVCSYATKVIQKNN
ncbi:MAG: GNAT family N-acetyltransferase [Erysipelotrichaceae bacterium]|nr:GNAT family N-acetyltransferase [Erysipelotrichaceae bacterium]